MRTWSRRQILVVGAAAAVAACTSSGSGSGDGNARPDGNEPTDPTQTTGRGPAGTTTEATDTAATADAALTAAHFDGLPSCVLLPEQTAGPFPLDEQLDRSDITETMDGHPLRLGFRVVDESCAPIGGAAVEVWHADATGDYSAFVDGGGGKDEGPGTTFGRGTQTAGDDGIVEFKTIYPGWYRGRAVHIHLRVHIDGSTVLTSQVYFDEAYTETVFTEDPYAEFGPPDTSWATDAIAGDPASDGTALVLSADGSGTLALLNLAVAAA